MTSIEAHVVGRVAAGAAPRKLARLAARLTADNRNDDPLILALRLGLDQLFRRDNIARRSYLIVAADGLCTLRGGHHLNDDDLAVLDLVQAACLARAGEVARARVLVDEQRRRLLRADLKTVLDDIESEIAQ